MTDSQAETRDDAKTARTRGNRKIVDGLVGSAKMHKTITVLVDRMVKHPKYKKFMRRTTKYYAHDESDDAREGDLVRIVETRPLSKLKRWRLLEVLVRAPRVGDDAEQAAGTNGEPKGE